MSDREAMKLALKALEAMQSYAAAERKGLRICDEAIEALRDRLAAPRPEPVAWGVRPKSGGELDYVQVKPQIGWDDLGFLEMVPLYTAPPAAAPRPEPEPVRHPGYVIGNHWLETAYERLCAGEAEDAILEDYELAREPRLRDLRLNDARYRWMTKDDTKYETRRRVRNILSLFNAYAYRKEHIDAAIDAAMQEDKT
jgi:hypothetical protein